MKKIICDTNVFYRLSDQRLKKDDIVREGEQLYYTPIQLLEITAELSDEEYRKRRAAARAILDFGAAALPEPDSFLAQVFGYELRETPFEWSHGVKALSQSASLNQLLGGVVDHSDRVIRTVNIAEAAHWCAMHEEQWKQTILKHVVAWIPGFLEWYHADRLKAKMPRLPAERRLEYLEFIRSDECSIELLLQCQTSAFQKARLYDPSEATEENIAALAAASNKLSCYIGAIKEYLCSIVVEGALPEGNDFEDSELFLFSTDDEWVIATSDAKWIRLARRAGFPQRVREIHERQFDYSKAQASALQLWDERGYFHSRPDPSREPFTIVIPPPNVTGALHLGHALNNILQDVLIRWRRMQGFNTLWMPGTDHAGIATQAVVERRIREEEGKTRHDLGREELVKRIWQWKDQYEARILRQLKELGCSCDWQRTRFTLDPICARAVRQTFFNFFRDGLIFRGKRLVNWDTQLQTAVADDEIYHETVKGGFWTFRYPVKGSNEFIRFSTTRPETMLGDTAVAVHPDDARYQHLIGKMVTIPLVGRDIPIIADAELVDPTLGTGAVKVTPAHDPNDYACGLRQKLPMINILNPDGSINEHGGAFAGLERLKARERVTEEMEKLGLFDGREDRDIDLAHSDRSKSPIEPYLSDQWFVKMADLAQTAMDAVTDGRVKFFPARYAKTYLDWLGEKRDWCISRQLWWGHRIPIWYAKCPEAELKKAFAGRNDVVWRLDEDNGQWLICGLDDIPSDALGAKYPLEQDPDVLDTWFSSALWPHSTLGWPEMTPELAYYYPTSVLVTSRGIITLWVARMVITGLYNLKKVPFRDVYIHPTILDGFGETMSKSKGNGVDPLDIISLYGADALRFVITQMATATQDSRMPVANVCPHCGKLVPQKREHLSLRTRKISCPECKKPFRPGGPWPAEDADLKTAKQASERFEAGRNFANKIWNAARFLLLNLDGYTPEALRLENLPIEDRWILSRLATTTAAISEQLEGYHFSEAARTIYEFTWSEFCDWYLEMSKGRLRDEAGRAQVQRVLVGVLDGILRLVQPIMPFVAESIWQAFNEAAFERGLPGPEPSTESVAIAPWPQYPPNWKDPAMERSIARMQELVRAVREVRNRYTIDPKTTVDTFVKCGDTVAGEFRQLAPFITMLAGVGRLEQGADVKKPAQAASHVEADFEVYVSLAGLIDVPAELKRLEKQIAEKRKHLQATQAKLANASFVDKAPAEVVQQQRELVAELEAQIAALEANRKELAEG